MRTGTTKFGIPFQTKNGGAFEKLDANCNGNRQLGNKSVIQERLPLACVVNGTR